MAFFPPFVGPRAAFADLRSYIRHSSRDKWVGGALAVLTTLIIVIIFLADSNWNTAPPARIVYVEQWSANRSDAEIVEQQKIDQGKREEAEKARREQFQRLDRKLDDLGI